MVIKIILYISYQNDLIFKIDIYNLNKLTLYTKINDSIFHLIFKLVNNLVLFDLIFNLDYNLGFNSINISYDLVILNIKLF